MTLNELYEDLNYVDSSRENRTKYANLVVNDLKLFPYLINIMFMVDDKISCKAAWVFEYVCSKDIHVIIPYLDQFTSNLKEVHLDSAVRPIAKVCEILATETELNLKYIYKERIIEACFDWMISEQKVAVKAYSMNALFLLGKDIDWVRPELKEILERDFSTQSAAFKARARHLLKKINRS